jgi:2-polyprenyl-6-methoxyphenol hydroxylase-like FAD-dependent oxidoreductase
MYSHKMTKRLLIIGGGIAGPVAAMALRKAGLDPVLYEAHGRGSDGVGAFLTLAVNGLNALAVLDLKDAVSDLGPAPF